MLFSSPGVATTIMMLRSKAVATLKFEAINDEEKANAQIKFVAKKIMSETKHMTSIVKNYTKVNKENIFDVSQTLLDLLSNISKHLHLTLPAAIIISIITSSKSSKTTMLQLALSLVAHSKGVIEHFHEYGMSSTYHKLWRFKVLAVAKNVKKMSFTGDFKAETGLIQIVSDSFDANMHTQNGLKQTHAMATIIAVSMT